MNRPSTSERIIRRFASVRFATNPARLSLSPKRISSVATVSFSFITGMTLYSRRVEMVFLEFNSLVLLVISSPVRRT